MGKIIRAVRSAKPHRIPTNIYKKGKVSLPKMKGNFTGTIKEIVHEPGRSAPLARIAIETEGKRHDALIVATEGMHKGKEIMFGQDADYDIGNCVQLKDVPVGSYVSFVEKNPFDGGRYAMSSGSYVIVSHYNEDSKIVTLTLRSGTMVNVSDKARCVIGVVAGGGKLDKPLLKAGNAAKKHKYKRGRWPVVRGVAMNPVDHPHGGGNFQHIGHPSTVSKHTPINARVGLVGARRTGKKKGSSKVRK
ncbi:60S ribosomal protein L8 [Dictyocoela muelleri]|nr:60S ribosomal protein L8 [Dictyocoela muelleri]